jgi:hypothetical protein
VRLRFIVGQATSFTNWYVWQFGGNTLLRGTNFISSRSLYTNDLLLTNVTPAQSGAYTFLITNSAGVQANYTVRLTLGSLDRDGDGIPDDWETAHGLNPDDPADAALDLDGDRMSNRNEYIAGTDPGDETSYLKIDSITAEAGALLSFQAVSNKTYTVQYSDTLAPAAWSNLAHTAARATNWTATATDPTPGTNRVYRLATPATP